MSYYWFFIKTQDNMFGQHHEIQKYREFFLINLENCYFWNNANFSKIFFEKSFQNRVEF